MNPNEIYQRLWSAEDDKKVAQAVINDVSLPPLLRVWALLRLGKHKEAKRSFENLQSPPTDELERMWFEELSLFFGSSKMKPVEFKEHLISLIERFPCSIWAQITLANILEAREYEYAHNLYTAVLRQCPSNLRAIEGLIYTSIRLGNRDKASLVLKENREKRILRRLIVCRKVYWGTVFSVYGIILGEKIGLQVLLGIIIFLMGILAPATIALPLAMLVIGILLGLYFISNMLVSLFFLSYAFLLALTYFIGYGVKILFIFLETL